MAGKGAGLVARMAKEESDVRRAALRRLRQDRDLTQVEMARLLGVSPQYVYRIEAGYRDLHDGYVEILCREFGVRPDYFTGAAVKDKRDEVSREDVRTFLRVHGLTSDDIEEIDALIDIKLRRRGVTDGG